MSVKTDLEKRIAQYNYLEALLKELVFFPFKEDFGFIQSELDIVKIMKNCSYTSSEAWSCFNGFLSENIPCISWKFGEYVYVLGGFWELWRRPRQSLDCDYEKICEMEICKNNFSKTHIKIPQKWRADTTIKPSIITKNLEKYHRDYNEALVEELI